MDPTAATAAATTEQGTGTVTPDPSSSAAALLPSLRIPLQSSSSEFVEIFPEELKDASVATLLQVFRDEKVPLDVWAAAGHLLVTQHLTREALQILQEACEDITTTTGTLGKTSAGSGNANKADKVRVLAATGIVTLLAAARDSDNNPTGGTSSHTTTATSHNTDWQAADQKFTQAGKVDTFFPMTWVGRGLLNLQRSSLDQAKFFFQTTKKQCGPVLPALLGMAAVYLAEGKYSLALNEYVTAIRQFPTASGAAARVGLATAAYKLGQVDRAKAAFQRAQALDPEYVPALVGIALLDMRATTAADRDFSQRMEVAVKLLSVANLLDSQNAMVQNHLANHYFWKWTPVRMFVCEMCCSLEVTVLF
jgi:RNA polymerase-associated protein CTR9